MQPLPAICAFSACPNFGAKGEWYMAAQKLRLDLWLRYWMRQRLAPHVATPPHVVRRMLELAQVQSSDSVVDLGCGDARLLIAAAKHCGAPGHGAELDSALLAEAQRAVHQAGLGHMITLELCDALAVDLSRSSVVTLYLTERGNDLLLPKLQQELPAGARVVSFCWPFARWEPSSVTRVDGISLYLYTIGKAVQP